MSACASIVVAGWGSFCEVSDCEKDNGISVMSQAVSCGLSSSRAKSDRGSLSFKVVIPTLDAEQDWDDFYDALICQVQPEDVLIVDSASTDRTVALAQMAGFRVVEIARSEFNHGRTRQMAANLLSDADILVYLTQDAVLASRKSLRAITEVFENPEIGAAYGRQLPRKVAAPLEAHARLFNYPSTSDVRCLQDRQRLGFKTVFASNSFSAYRRSALLEVGGFPVNAIVSEETIVFAKMQIAGWKTAYVAEATAYHSHNYSLHQTFSRYFDIGVSYSRDSWIYQTFRSPDKEGMRFPLSELRFLYPENAHLIPVSLLHTLAKFVGYKLGFHEALLPTFLKRCFSAQKNFWNRNV